MVLLEAGWLLRKTPNGNWRFQIAELLGTGGWAGFEPVDCAGGAIDMAERTTGLDVGVFAASGLLVAKTQTGPAGGVARD